MLLFFLVCSTISIINTVAVTVFVTSNGTDHVGCGVDQYDSCGTLHYASMIAQSVDESEAITMYINGQNELEIIKYFASSNDSNTSYYYHPCFPKPFTSIHNLTITFVNQYNWFPNDCSNQNERIAHEYMFDVTADYLFIDGLNIQYVANTLSVGIIRNDFYLGQTICHNCVFHNIYSRISYPLIDIKSTLYLIQNDFYNLTLSDDLIFTYNSGGHLQIEQTDFTNIYTTGSIIGYTEVDTSSDAYISSSTFTDIRMGSVLHITNVGGAASDITIENAFISTSQLYDDNEDGIFNFARGSVTMINITFMYRTDIWNDCYINKNATYDALNMTYTESLCIAHTPFIVNNDAVIMMDTIYILNTITTPIYEEYKDAMAPQSDILFMRYVPISGYDINENWATYSAIILNNFEIHLTNLHINGYASGAAIFIQNNKLLNVTNLRMILAESFNPNVIQPTYLILQQGVTQYATSLRVSNSVIVGGIWQIHCTIGSVHITNSKFEYSGYAHQVWLSEDIVIKNNSYYRLGRYYSGFYHGFIKVFNYPTIVTVFSKNVVLAENRFDCWDPDGFIIAFASTNIVISHNIFSVNSDSLFYDIPSSFFLFEDFGGLVVSFESSDTYIMWNEFKSNTIDPMTPWINYIGDKAFHTDKTHGKDEKYGIHCLAANNFTNFAFHLSHTNVTSCFREHLIDCLYDNYCLDGLYGTVEESLTDAISYFNIDTDVDVFRISTDDSFVALDNIHINGGDLFINCGHLLILDSILSNSSVLYNASMCDIQYNERLIDDMNVIYKMLINCGSHYISDISNEIMDPMSSPQTQFVDHLSASKIHFFSDSTTYFPGQFLYFDYNIYDKLGNVIQNPMFHNLNHLSGNPLIVILENKEELGFFAEFLMDNTGDCSVCDNGISISALNLKQHLGGTFNISIDLSNTILTLTDTHLSLNVNGCPIGYGSSSNGYICDICDSGTYNLYPNNTNECNFCNNNRELRCQEQTIYVAHNSWIGFDAYDTGVISSYCPPLTCCQKDECNYLIDEYHFCAANRNYTVPLCGSCLNGYSESMNSVNCTKCDMRNQWQWITITIVLSLLYAIFILLSASKPVTRTERLARILNKLNILAFYKNANFQLMIRVMILKVIMYYQQALSTILSTTPIEINVSVLANVFNLSFDYVSSNSDEDSLWCFIKGLTAKQKVLTSAMSPILITMFLSIFYLMSKFVFSFVLFNKRILHYGKSFIALLLLCIGSIVQVLFKILNCHTVSSTMTVHFYFAKDECYGIAWFIALLSLLFVTGCFVLIFLKIKNMDPNKRQTEENPLIDVVKHYKSEYYYWEFVLFFRRIFIVMLSVSITDSNHYSKVVLIVILLICLYFQYKLAPFRIEEANTMEFILLGGLVVVVTMNLILVNSDQVDIVLWILTILTLLPFPIFIFYVISAASVVRAEHLDSISEIKMNRTQSSRVPTTETASKPV